MIRQSTSSLTSLNSSSADGSAEDDAAAVLPNLRQALPHSPPAPPHPDALAPAPNPAPPVGRSLRRRAAVDYNEERIWAPAEAVIDDHEEAGWRWLWGEKPAQAKFGTGAQVNSDAAAQEQSAPPGGEGTVTTEPLNGARGSSPGEPRWANADEAAEDEADLQVLDAFAAGMPDFKKAMDMVQDHLEQLEATAASDKKRAEEHIAQLEIVAATSRKRANEDAARIDKLEKDAEERDVRHAATVKERDEGIARIIELEKKVEARNARVAELEKDAEVRNVQHGTAMGKLQTAKEDAEHRCFVAEERNSVLETTELHRQQEYDTMWGFHNWVEGLRDLHPSHWADFNKHAIQHYAKASSDANSKLLSLRDRRNKWRNAWRAGMSWEEFTTQVGLEPDEKAAEKAAEVSEDDEEEGEDEDDEDEDDEDDEGDVDDDLDLTGNFRG